MRSLADGPFVEIRARKPKERGHKDGCHCGLPFQFVAITENGAKRFYWCSRCDVAGRK